MMYTGVYLRYDTLSCKSSAAIQFAHAALERTFSVNHDEAATR